jgi:hypothetical protein
MTSAPGCSKLLGATGAVRLRPVRSMNVPARPPKPSDDRSIAKWCGSCHDCSGGRNLAARLQQTLDVLTVAVVFLTLR